MKNRMYLAALLCAATVISCSKDEDGNGGGYKENPNPTEFGNVWLVKSDIAVDPDGFNMFTDGGFERFAGDLDWKEKSLWYLPEYISEAETPYNGARTLYADCNSHDWRDVAIQSVCLKKNASYTLSVNFRGAWNGLNVYMGFRGAAVHDQNTNTPDEGTEWKEYSYTLANTDDVKVDAFLGGFCWDNLWIEADDFKVIPSGTNNDSFKPQNAAVIAAKITNASFNSVQSVGKTVAWVEPSGKIAAVLHDVVVGDKPCGNVFAASNGGLTAEGVKLVSVGDEDMLAESGVVPTAGITSGNTRYVRYYTYAGMSSPAEGEGEPDWTASASGLLSSSDGGRTWTKTAAAWNADGNFVKASLLAYGNYVYMFGSAAGDSAVTTYVARVAPAKIADAAAYEYWDGGEWVVGDETAAAPICYGPTDEMSVVYNASRYTFMMIYRSKTTGCLVYRDSGMPEGEWSGEKILMADPDESTALYAPHILSVDNNTISFLASRK